MTFDLNLIVICSFGFASKTTNIPFFSGEKNTFYGYFGVVAFYEKHIYFVCENITVFTDISEYWLLAENMTFKQNFIVSC